MKSLYQRIDEEVLLTGYNRKIYGLVELEKLSEMTGYNHESISYEPDELLINELKDVILEWGICSADDGLPSIVEEYFSLHGVSKFEDVVKLMGVIAATGLWYSNLRDIIKESKAIEEDLYFCREDVYDYFKRHGMTEEQSKYYAEDIRKGKLCRYTDDKLKVFKAYGIPDWYVDSCKKTRYLPPRNIIYIRATVMWRLAYYKSHKADAFYKKSDEGTSTSEQAVTIA